VTPPIKLLAELSPALPINMGKLVHSGRVEARGRGGDKPHRSTAAGEAVLRPVARRSW
jgi:hypothetical protein